MPVTGEVAPVASVQQKTEESQVDILQLEFTPKQPMSLLTKVMKLSTENIIKGMYKYTKCYAKIQTEHENCTTVLLAHKQDSGRDLLGIGLVIRS